MLDLLLRLASPSGWFQGLLFLGVTVGLGLAGWTIHSWREKSSRLDAAEIAAKQAQQALEAERVDRARADLDRLAASQEFHVKLQGIEDRTTILLRETVRYVPDDRPCLPPGAVVQLNATRGRQLQTPVEK